MAEEKVMGPVEALKPALAGTIIIIMLAGVVPAAYPVMQTGGILIPEKPKAPLIKQSGGHERRMINDMRLDTFYTVKVTTENQAKYDTDRDGYLSGTELQNYLRRYNR